MIELYYWPTPNGHKITMFLEEVKLAYRVLPVDITLGDQFRPEYLAFSPNNKMPAIVDTEPGEAGDEDRPLTIFESGAILLYLAEKVGKLVPTDLRGRKAVAEWLFWQVSGLGPAAAQNHYFSVFAAEKIPSVIDRYVKETSRLYGVLDRRLAKNRYVAGDDYTIADIATYPWIVPHRQQHQRLEEFPHLHRWFDDIRGRPSTIRAYDQGKAFMVQPALSKESRAILFGQREAERAKAG